MTRAGRVTAVKNTGFRQRAAAISVATVILLLVQGCERNPYQLTECVDGKPVVERIHDVAPPNC